MDAVIKVTQHPATRARTATAVMSALRSGAIELIAPIMIPIDDGLAKLQRAKVAIAAERS